MCLYAVLKRKEIAALIEKGLKSTCKNIQDNIDCDGYAPDKSQQAQA
jgi:hypothetical protein